MSMTWKEAILLSAYTGVLLVPDFSDVHKFCEDTLGRPIWTHEFADQDVQKEIREKLRPQIMELVQNIATLRPVSRERGEKGWKGEWLHPHWHNSESCADCSRCNADVWHREFRGVQTEYNFCPVCGAAQNDKAVDMVMERMDKCINLT